MADTYAYMSPALKTVLTTHIHQLTASVKSGYTLYSPEGISPSRDVVKTGLEDKVLLTLRLPQRLEIFCKSY